PTGAKHGAWRRHANSTGNDQRCTRPRWRRFQGVLRAAQRERSWHVVAAPGSGKSYGISDLVGASGACKEATGQTRLPILAVRAPKNLPRESALAAALTASFGV